MSALVKAFRTKIAFELGRMTLHSVPLPLSQSGTKAQFNGHIINNNDFIAQEADYFVT